MHDFFIADLHNINILNVAVNKLSKIYSQCVKNVFHVIIDN